MRNPAFAREPAEGFRRDGMSADGPIGVFDSGLGGLSVLREIRRLLPAESLIYFGDQAHVPYGARPMEQIQAFSNSITRFLLERGAKLIVLACNTASAAALTHLRSAFPAIPIVGMEPAVKPAAERTRTGQVGVLATPATFQGALYASVVERFGNGVELHQHTCPGLVERIEQGELDAPATRAILEDALRPMLDHGIDTVVLGCTHYPFVIPLIQEIVGDRVRVIDPAPAVARQVGRVLQDAGRLRTAPPPGVLHFYTSGDAGRVGELTGRLLGERHPITRALWDGDRSVRVDE